MLKYGMALALSSCWQFLMQKIFLMLIFTNSVKLPGKLDRLNNWHQFASAVKKKMKTVKNASQTLFWFGTAETAMPMVGKLNGCNYALTSLELLDDNKTKNRLLVCSQEMQSSLFVARQRELLL